MPIYNGPGEKPFDPEAPENLVELPEHVGIRMQEVDSYERIIDGLKSAADAMRHLVNRRQDTRWDQFADVVDKTRFMIARKSGNYRAGDAEASKARKTSDSLWSIEAYERVHDGFRAAAAAARQMATAHRGDLQWSIWAEHIEGLRNRGSALVRRAVMERSGRVISEMRAAYAAASSAESTAESTGNGFSTPPAGLQ